MNLVRQKDVNGCVVASLAMVTGKTYEDVRAHTLFDRLADEKHGCGPREPEAYLREHGFAWQLLHRCMPPGNTWLVDWPPVPWADAHVVEVRMPSNSYHCVVLLRSGTVLDPFCDEPRRLSDYPEVISVRAVFRVGCGPARGMTTTEQPTRKDL